MPVFDPFPEGYGDTTDWVLKAAEMLALYGISYTVRNPAEAVAIVAVLSNPTLRGTALELALMMGKGAVRDWGSAAKILNNRLVKPSARSAGRTGLVVLRHPAFQSMAFVLGASALSTHSQQQVNSNAIAMNPSLAPALTVGMTDAELRREAIDSAPLMWSPFGGMGFGTVF
jgi:hypothetical protein